MSFLHKKTVANKTVKVASVICALPSGAMQADRHIVINQQGESNILMIHLEAAESALASWSISSESLAASTEK